jgi:hypothetical protein
MRLRWSNTGASPIGGPRETAPTYADSTTRGDRDAKNMFIFISTTGRSPGRPLERMTRRPPVIRIIPSPGNWSAGSPKRTTGEWAGEDCDGRQLQVTTAGDGVAQNQAHRGFCFYGS